ncbi:OmpA family protein [Fontimonas sp. SYSU GA230001]|uniref:OmpA family protein n=1 Tax=Fontimonas sp. SYSU GA230001 TaxID=3142450 RepID=UPI0032B3D497
MLGASLARQIGQDRFVVAGLAIPDVTGKLKTSKAEEPPPTIRIVAVPIVDAESGESVAVTAEIERIVFDEIRRASTTFSVERMTPNNLQAADHILFGTIIFDTYQQKRRNDQKRYHVYCTIVEKASKRIVARADAWISNRDLNYSPAEMFQDSPVFPRDRRLQSLVAIAKSPLGAIADNEYYDSLETNALIAEAETTFARGDYRQALELFRKAADRPDGQVIKTYIGLYRSQIKQMDLKAAEETFAKLLPIAAEEGSLSTKFLFTVNSTEFVSDRGLRSQYDMWIRQMARYFSSRSDCLRIVGHSSRTGSEQYNDQLSLMRAEQLRARLGANAPVLIDKSTAIGVGFSQNIIGSGTDDARDALDRRVEVSLRGCS